MPSTTSGSTPPTLLLLHSLPPSIFLGLDLLSLTATPNFHGIKNLPPGYHFLYSSSDASLSIRHGQWFYVAPPQPQRGEASPPSPAQEKDQSVTSLSIWRWSREDECLKREEDTQLGRSRLPASLRGSLGSGLLNYVKPEDHGGTTGLGSGALVSEWRELTGFITKSLLDRVLGGGADENGLAGTTESPRRPSGASMWMISSGSSAPQDVDEIPGLTPSEARVDGERQLNFIPIDLKKTWREGAVGRERTDAARDKSWYLSHLIEQVAVRHHGAVEDRKYGPAQLLGELQMCFLMVLTLANWSCLQQWKRILAVLLGCRNAMIEVEGYFVSVLQVLLVQLRHCDDVEGGLFDFKEDGAGWLRELLMRFRRNVEELVDPSKGKGLKAELHKVEEYLHERHGWENGQDVLKRGLLELEDGEQVDIEMDGADEEDEIGEYAPVVVDLA